MTAQTLIPCDNCGSTLGTSRARDTAHARATYRLVLCHTCDVHDRARCRYCDDRIDPRNYAKDDDGLACLPCDDERARISALHH